MVSWPSAQRSTGQARATRPANPALAEHPRFRACASRRFRVAVVTGACAHAPARASVVPLLWTICIAAARQSDAPYLGVVAASGGVCGWVWRQPACFGAAEVGVALVAEEDVSPPDVLVLADGA